MGPIVADGALAHAVHHVGHRHPGVDVVDDERAAPSTPVADVLVGRDRRTRRVQAVADAERHADAEHEVATGRLDVEDPLDGRRRQQLDAARRAAGRHHRLGERDAAGVAVAAGGRDLGPPPRDLPRLRRRRGGGWRRGTGSSPSGSAARPAQRGRRVGAGRDHEGDAVVVLGRRCRCGSRRRAGRRSPRRRTCPTLRPSTRRTTSPTRLPWVRPWYPDFEPGSHHGACLASSPHTRSQS